MTPVMPCSISGVSLIPGTAFTSRKNNCFTRFSSSRKPTKLAPSTQKYLLPVSTSIKLFPQYSRGCSLHHISGIQRLSATGTDVAVEEPDSPIVDEDSGGASEVPTGAVGSGESSSSESEASPASTTARRTRPVRKSEMPPLKNEELVPGATFTGKVRSIQPFGAFVDFGAFTDGLVHVSRLSDSYVKDVGSIVSVGQEVKVRLVEANTETGRISLSMRESDDTSNRKQQKDGPASGDKAGPAKRNVSRPSQRRGDARKSSKFVKGQDLEGTVKNMTRSGAFISLPEGEEGFLPTSEESDEGFGSLMGNSSLQVGQEVSVRVLRISRGMATLTMKKEEDVAKLDSQLKEGVVHVATNPFVLAFHKNKDIAAFLDERQKLEKEAEKPAITKTSEELEEKVDQSKTGSDEVQDQAAGSYERTDSVPSTVDETIKDNEASSEEAGVGASALDDASTNIVDNEEGPASSSTQSIDTIDKEAEVSSEILAPEESISISSGMNEEASLTDGAEIDGKSDLLGGINDEASSKEVDLVASVADDEKDQESTISSSISSVDGTVQTVEEEAEVSSEILKAPSAENEPPSGAPTEINEAEPNPDKNGSITSSGLQPDAPSAQETKGPCLFSFTFFFLKFLCFGYGILHFVPQITTPFALTSLNYELLFWEW
jgi:elongation factor Ts